MDQPEFYQNDDNAERTYKFYEWLIENFQKDTSAFNNVGALELVNEPLQNTEDADTDWLVEKFYPTAIDRIRAKESSLGVSSANALHIVTMVTNQRTPYQEKRLLIRMKQDDKWDAGGNPTRSLDDTQKENLLFDDHNYESYIVSEASSIDGFVSDACGDNRKSAVSPKIVGEWSLTFGNSGDSFTPMSSHASSYSKWFSAQQRQYEALNGWIFWTWKTDDGLVNVEQWNYQSEHYCPAQTSYKQLLTSLSQRPLRQG